MLFVIKDGEPRLLMLLGTIGNFVETSTQVMTPVFAVAEFNYESLHKALEQLADFEKNANLRVVQSGVLKGLCMEDIRRAGQSLVLQDGCRGFFEKIVKSENFVTDVHVLSYCWCGDLIRSAFSSGTSIDFFMHTHTQNIYFVHSSLYLLFCVSKQLRHVTYNIF